MPEPLFYLGFYALTATFLLLVSAIIRIEYRLQNPAIFFWIALLVIYVVPSIFDPFRSATQIMNGPTIDLRENVVLIRAHIFGLLFSAIYFLVRLASYGSELRRRQTTISVSAFPEALRKEPDLKVFLLFGTAVIGLAAMLEILAIVPRMGWSGLLSSTYGSYRLESNTALKLMGYYLVYAFGGICFVSWVCDKRKLAALLFTMIFAVFLVGRTRQLLFPAIIPFCLYFIYRARGVKGWAFLISGIAVGYVFILMLQFFRYQEGLVEGFTALGKLDFYISIYQGLQEAKGEALIRYIFYHFIDENTDIPEFMHGLTYVRLLLLPFPSVLLGDFKPIDYDMILYQHYFGSGLDVGATIHPLIFGNAFTNFGWLGVILGGFWALMFHILNLYIMNRPLIHRILILSMTGFIVMMIARGSVYNSLAVVFWGLLILEAFFVVFRTLTVSRRRSQVDEATRDQDVHA